MRRSDATPAISGGENTGGKADVPPEVLSNLLAAALSRRSDYPTPLPLDATPAQEVAAFERDAEIAHDALLRTQMRIAAVRYYRARLAELKAVLSV